MAAASAAGSAAGTACPDSPGGQGYATPDPIAVLRLDTDWYESTRHELEHLYPRLSVGGVLIIDDYGYWQGARKAVDEYFAGGPILLNRVDATARVALKTAPTACSSTMKPSPEPQA